MLFYDLRYLVCSTYIQFLSLFFRISSVVQLYNMGGLFSKKEDSYESAQRQWQQHEAARRQHEEIRQREEAIQRARYHEQLQREELQQLQIAQIRRNHIKSLVPISSRCIRDIVLKDGIAENWNPMLSGQSFIKVNVPDNTNEYRIVLNSFRKTTQKRFTVVQIERVQNPHLLGCYLLKKLEMSSMFGNVTEQLVFHGTKQSNVQNICENNFNWRLHGASIGNRFGKGVSFSPISNYASHYSDKHTSRKIMFLVRVLISKVTEGNPDMTLPPYIGRWGSILRFDTTLKKDGHVIVKYCDNDFYPQYLIHYTVGPQMPKITNSNYKSNYRFTDYDDIY